MRFQDKRVKNQCEEQRLLSANRQNTQPQWVKNRVRFRLGLG